MDHLDEDFTDPGYYRVFYGRTQAPSGPFATLREMAFGNRLADYPDDGYVVHYDGEGVTSLPSLNPDDLVPMEREDGEVVVRLADGWSLRSGSEEFQSGDYVRLCRPDGTEYAYWDNAEWEADPVLVMGAILNSAAGFRIEDAPCDNCGVAVSDAEYEAKHAFGPCPEPT